MSAIAAISRPAGTNSGSLQLWYMNCKHKQSNECAELSCQQLAFEHVGNTCVTFPGPAHQDKEPTVTVLIGNIAVWIIDLIRTESRSDDSKAELEVCTISSLHLSSLYLHKQGSIPGINLLHSDFNL